MSVRETALVNLLARITTGLAGRSPAPVLGRNLTIPQALPAGGLVVLRDGELANSQTILSPLSYAIEHAAEIEIIARSSTPALTAVLLDALLEAIGAAIVADRTLGGAVEWAEPSAPAFEDVPFEGAAAARAATVTVSLFFTVAASPLS